MAEKIDCYCSFCRNERKYSPKKHIGIKEITLSIVGAVLLSLVFWQKLDPRMMVFSIILLLFFEVAIHFSWRLGIICPFCGFDPILYLRSPEEAAKKVKDYMATRKEEPSYYLSKHTLDKLPKRRESKTEAK